MEQMTLGKHAQQRSVSEDEVVEKSGSDVQCGIACPDISPYLSEVVRVLRVTSRPCLKGRLRQRWGRGEELRRATAIARHDRSYEVPEGGIGIRH